jgi:ubiquinone/menaquinone biosynthesis C-methylase UbiE
MSPADTRRNRACGMDGVPQWVRPCKGPVARTCCATSATMRETQMRTVERLLSLLDHLRLEVGHFATQVPGDIVGLAEEHPERIAGLVLCVPTRLDARPFARVADRLLMISGELGLSAQMTLRAKERLPQAQRRVLDGYDPAGWSDVVADRREHIGRWMSEFLSTRQPAAACAGVRCEPNKAFAGKSGTHAGLSFTVSGRGPALVLLPLFLAASQWEPALPELTRHFTVIQLGGPHIGGVAALEDRASAPTYQAMFRTLVDLMAPSPGSRILEVGCGSGALVRALAARLGPEARIDAVDVNRFLLREAAALAGDLGQRIRFAPGSALALPFADGTFDHVYSVTMLEECDADAAIAEIVRVARPGARIGLVVRATDMAQWWNLELPAELKAKAMVPPLSISPGGVADASLYRRMQRAGLGDLRAFQALVTLDAPDGPIWRYREDPILSQLSPEETATWNAARAAAAGEGLLMQAHAFHCAVATKRG